MGQVSSTKDCFILIVLAAVILSAGCGGQMTNEPTAMAETKVPEPTDTPMPTMTVTTTPEPTATPSPADMPVAGVGNRRLADILMGDGGGTYWVGGRARLWV